MPITYNEKTEIAREQIVHLYRANNWSSAEKPATLQQALHNSHALISAWDNDTLVGLANAISDGHLVVYYPHMLVLPDYQGQGIGKMLMAKLLEKYQGFHQHMITADADAIGFYKKCGFTQAGKTASMWIYAGDDH
ncbi:MAG: GNAT family N-acetyltransferase [Thermodesulfobacteriota bacterium]